MKILYRCDITRVALQREAVGKYSIDRVLVRSFRGRDHAIATDGRMIAYVPVEMEEHDVPGMFVADAFVAARAEVEAVCEEEDASPTFGKAWIRLREDDRAQVGDSAFQCSRGLKKYPDVDIKIGGVPRATITLDAVRLLALAEAIGAAQYGVGQAVTLEIRDEREPVVVRPAGQDTGAFGLLMPIAEVDERVAADAAKPTGGVS